MKLSMALGPLLLGIFSLLISCQSTSQADFAKIFLQDQNGDTATAPIDDRYIGIMNSIAWGGGARDQGAESHPFLVFHLHFDNPALVRSWFVEFASQDGTIVYSQGGASPKLPRMVIWDGRNRNGLMSPSGTYEARLTVDYGTHGMKSTKSGLFRLPMPQASGAGSTKLQSAAWDQEEVGFEPEIPIDALE